LTENVEDLDVTLSALSLRFEELWEKYEDDPDCDRKIADELGCTLLHDHGHEGELIEQEFSEGVEMEDAAAQCPEPLWFQYPLIERAKDLCVAVSEFGRSDKLSLCRSGRLDELQVTLGQGMAKLGDALHGVIAGNEVDPDSRVCRKPRLSGTSSMS